MIRTRLAVVAVLAVGLTAAGLALERSLGVRPAAVETVSTPDAASGAWFCPHGGGDGWATWLIVANPSETSSDLVLTARGATVEESTMTLEPHTHRYVAVDSPTLSAGSTVEFFGGPVVTSMVIARPDDGGLAAEPCTMAAAGRWYVPDGTSEVEGEAANVVVLNPTEADAVVDIVLTTERDTLRPGPLQGIVLGPGRVKSFDLNRFILGARTVGARVSAAVGRVAVAGIGLSEGGIRADIGVPELAQAWYLPGTGDGGRGELVVEAAGEEVPFQARVQGRQEQVPALEQETVEAGQVRTFTVATLEGGLVAAAEGSVGFVAARRSSFGGAGVEDPEEEAPGDAASPAPTETPSPQPTPSPGTSPTASPTPPGGPSPTPTTSPSPAPRTGRDRPESDGGVDRAGTTGAPSLASTWVVPPATGPDGGPAALVLQNPGSRPVRARVALMGESGPVEAPALEEVDIPAGRVAVIDLADLAPEPVTAVIDATGGVVAAQVALSPQAYAVSLGSPAGSVLTDSSSGI